MPNITYVGAPFVGKGENLRCFHTKCIPDERTKLQLDRAGVFTFKYSPRALKNDFHLVTVSGVMRNEAKRSAIDVADGIVFVVDSRPDRQESNATVLRDVVAALLARGYGPGTFPMVMQYNWRDVAGAVPVVELERTLNVFNAPYVEAVATKGVGVVDTVKAMAKLLVKRR
jgi:signal recognition particle receptor subunit beta